MFARWHAGSGRERPAGIHLDDAALTKGCPVLLGLLQRLEAAHDVEALTRRPLTGS